MFGTGDLWDKHPDIIETVVLAFMIGLFGMVILALFLGLMELVILHVHAMVTGNPCIGAICIGGK